MSTGKDEVKKNPLPPHVPPRIKDPIPKSENPGGPHTPGAKAKKKKKEKKNADSEGHRLTGVNQ